MTMLNDTQRDLKARVRRAIERDPALDDISGVSTVKWVRRVVRDRVVRRGESLDRVLSQLVKHHTQRCRRYMFEVAQMPEARPEAQANAEAEANPE